MSVLTERRAGMLSRAYTILVYSPPATKEMQTWINSSETKRYQIRCEYITCCILHAIQSRARWYATVPLREKWRSHYWTDHLSGRLCVRSASHDLRQSIVKWTKQAGIIVYRSCTPIQSPGVLKKRVSDQTQFRSSEEESTRSSSAIACTRGEPKVPWRWIARSYVGREKDTIPSQGRNTHTVGCLLYRRTLSGFRVAERKHFSSLPPPPSRRRASRSILRRKAPCFQN